MALRTKTLLSCQEIEESAKYVQTLENLEASFSPHSLDMKWPNLRSHGGRDNRTRIFLFPPLPSTPLMIVQFHERFYKTDTLFLEKAWGNTAKLHVTFKFLQPSSSLPQTGHRQVAKNVPVKMVLGEALTILILSTRSMRCLFTIEANACCSCSVSWICLSISSSCCLLFSW